MEISDAYRQSRRRVSLVCGISLAWAAAQFELKSLIIGKTGPLDISGASIHILLSLLIVYMLIRMTIEFMMQTKEVRRWKLAQVDYKITLNLIRISLLALAASTLSRSMEAVITIFFSAAILIIGYILLVSLLVAILMPLRMRIRARQGRISAASSAIESVDWSILIAGIIYIGLFLYFGRKAIDFLPFISSLATPPSTTSMIVFVAVSIIALVSLFFENRLLQTIFAFEPKKIVETTPLENGKIAVTFKDNPKHPDYVAPKATTNDSES